MKKPNRTLLPPEETAIAGRLREWRLERRIGGAVFARACRLAPENLIVWERARAPLPWGAFTRIWRAFGVSPAWLATGDGLRVFPFADEFRPLLRHDADVRFSRVFERIAPTFTAIEDDLRPLHVARIEEFLAAARAGSAPRGALAVVAEATHRVAPVPGAIRISAPATPNFKKPKPNS